MTKIKNKEFTYGYDMETTSGAEGGYPVYEEEHLIKNTYMNLCFKLRLFCSSTPVHEILIGIKWAAIIKILLFL